MPLFYVKIRKNIDICNYLPIYYPAICRGWGTFSVPSLLEEFFSQPFKIDSDKISHVIIRPLKNDERIWYSKYDIPMNSSKSLFHEIVLDKDQNEIIDINPYITTFK